MYTTPWSFDHESLQKGRCISIKNRVAWLEGTIKSFINESAENTLRKDRFEKAFSDPVIGFSSGDDPLYHFYKEDIGDFYWTPQEIFERTFPGLRVTPGELTIISWILPQTEATKSDNRRQTFYPSERWARARIYGEEVNDKLRRHVTTTIQEAGFKAIAPMLSPFWDSGKISRRYGYASTWSERHAAYTSGLGTFGLCDGLITPKGKAMRCGSVITSIRVPSTKRLYSDHHAYCLFFTKGICGKCIQRCPAGAITEIGHNKIKCREHLQITKDYVRTRFGFKGYGCGLCQTNVPCESKIPTENDIESIVEQN